MSLRPGIIEIAVFPVSADKPYAERRVKFREELHRRGVAVLGSDQVAGHHDDVRRFFFQFFYEPPLPKADPRGMQVGEMRDLQRLL